MANQPNFSLQRDGTLLLPSRLRKEMENVLDDLQSDMSNELDKVSLERLADKNPKLLGDIKQAAEDTEIWCVEIY